MLFQFSFGLVEKYYLFLHYLRSLIKILTCVHFILSESHDFTFLKKIFIYLTVSGLSCGTQTLVVVWGLSWHLGSQFPDQGSHQCALHCKADS